MVDTWNYMPVSFPCSKGMTLVTTLTAPGRGRDDVAKDSTVNLSFLKGRRVENNLGGCHGMDSSLEGLLDVQLVLLLVVYHDNGLGVKLGSIDGDHRVITFIFKKYGNFPSV